jgi:hypothetical protein
MTRKAQQPATDRNRGEEAMDAQAYISHHVVAIVIGIGVAIYLVFFKDWKRTTWGVIKSPVVAVITVWVIVAFIWQGLLALAHGSLLELANPVEQGVLDGIHKTHFTYTGSPPREVYDLVRNVYEGVRNAERCQYAPSNDGCGTR